MENMTPITYRDFWDVPRIFIARREGDVLLFDCPLDETTEDYPNCYRVYLIPDLQDDELGGSWDKLHLKARRSLGEIPVRSVCFDATKRQGVATALLDSLAAPSENNGALHAQPSESSRRVG
jgi:hypothetical protein